MRCGLLSRITNAGFGANVDNVMMIPGSSGGSTPGAAFFQDNMAGSGQKMMGMQQQG